MTSRILRPRFFLVVSFLILLSVSRGFAQTGSITRIEQDDRSIAYSGNWYSNESSLNSGGKAVLTNSRGASATISFTGTAITWLGVTDHWAGLANVYLDGTLKIVDTYGPGGFQQVIYKAEGLSPGPHTLSIEVTHERGSANAEGSWVWIDAFDIENGASLPGGVIAPAGRVEEDDPSLVYDGRWFPNTNSAHSRAGARLAMDAGCRVTIQFNGTGINWIAYRDEWSGMARVYLDGEEKITIDTYLSPPLAQSVPYRIGGLPFGKHRLTLEVTGTHNESAKGSWVWLDAFDVVQ